jgi:hypothetical protein
MNDREAMMRKTIGVLAGLLVPGMLLAQLTQQWVAESDPANLQGCHFGKAVALDGSGNVYVVGSIPGGYLIVKYGPYGDRVWNTRLDGVNGGTFDSTYAIAVDRDGNLFITGGEIDYVTIKYNPDGTLGWPSLPGGVAHYEGGSEARAIVVDAAGNVFVAGCGSTAACVTVKYDAGGNELWAVPYDQGYGGANAIALDPSGNICVTGSAWTVKYDTDGNRRWASSYPGWASAIATDALGNVFVTGVASDIVTVKYGPNGVQLWTSHLGVGSDPGNNLLPAIAVDDHGNTYVTGCEGSGSAGNYLTAKYGPSGNQLWDSRYDGPGKDYDCPTDIALDGSGSVFVTGLSYDPITGYDYATLMYRCADGSQLDCKRFDAGTGDDWAISTASGPGGAVAVVGAAGRWNENVKLVTIKYLTATSGAYWLDNFESCQEGQWPTPNWTASGNSDGSIVTEVSHGGEKSFRLYGVPGAYWATLAHRYIGTDGVYTIEFYIRTGTEVIPPYGGEWRGSVDLHTAPSWVPPAANIMHWDKYGQVYGRGGLLLGTYSTLTWYHVKVLYERTATTVHMEYWIDGVLTGEENLPASSSEMQFDYFALTAGVGTSWFDDVSVKYVDPPQVPVLISPENGATNQDSCSVLTWRKAIGAEWYDVYLGTNPDDLSKWSGAYDTTFGYSGLAHGTTYYWKVVAKKTGGGTSSLVWSFTTGTRDVGVSEIPEPSGVIDTLSETPQAIVHNYGIRSYYIPVWFEVRDSVTPTPCYRELVEVNYLPGLGQDCVVTFPAWDVPNRDGRYYCRSWTELNNDTLNRSNDTAESWFAVEADAGKPPNWTQWPDVPAGPKGQDVGAGAAAATDAQGLCGYLLKGSSTCEFYRYDPATGMWLALDEIPRRGRDNKPRSVQAGGTLAQVNGKFYATKGGCLEFWEYDPAAAPGYRWTQKADVPAGNNNLSAGASAIGVNIGPAGHVYLLRASGTFEFYRYDVSNDHWQAMAAAPGQRGEEFKIGSAISFDGTDTVFALKGVLDKFYAYAVSTDSWLTKPDLPLGSRRKQAKGGAAIYNHMRRVYCIKGSNSQEFWVYNCDGDSWTQGSDVPLGARRSRVQDGGTLVYCRASRYLFCSKGTSSEFWSFGHLSNVIGPQSSEQVVAVQVPGVNTYGLATASALVPGRDRVFYALPKSGNVNLTLYDVTGRVARILVNGWQLAGRHEVSLDAASLAQGVYLLRYAASDCIESRKLIVQR